MQVWKMQIKNGTFCTDGECKYESARVENVIKYMPTKYRPYNKTIIASQTKCSGKWLKLL